MKIIGISGNRWTAVATVYAVTATMYGSGNTRKISSHIDKNDVRAAYDVLNSMIVWRGHGAYAPESALPMQLLDSAAAN